MFDDYRHKNKSKRISIRFVQERNEQMYPWEIAGFLNGINTVYYKFELLNSISSAIKEGISPADIFVFDKSLPLYKRYAELNLLAEPYAANYFYPIGLPYPLFPNTDIYQYNLLYQAFYTINSFLRGQHVRPLAIKNISSAYELMRKRDLDTAESFIIDLAEERSAKSYETSNKPRKKLITRSMITSSLEKYQRTKANLISEILYIGNLDDTELTRIVESDQKEDKRKSKILLSFFDYFNKTSRPLVCARVSEGKFRVLGRALVNKKEKAGLEVMEVARRSPLGTLFECGITIIQTIAGQSRASEIHQLEIEKKKTEIEIEKEKLAGEKLKNFKLTLDIESQLKSVGNDSDIHAIEHIPDSYIRRQLLRGYAIEQKHAENTINNRGLLPDAESVNIIDIKA